MADQTREFAFKAVAQDDAGSLAGALEGCDVQEWGKWHNRAGQSLIALCKERAACSAYSLLAGSLRLRAEVDSLTPDCDKRVKAFRAVAYDDIATLGAVLGGMPSITWLRWQNKAKKDLLSMSIERNSKGAYALLKKAVVSPLPVRESLSNKLKQVAPVITFEGTEDAPAPAGNLRDTTRSDKSCQSVSVKSEVWQDDTAHLTAPMVHVTCHDDAEDNVEDLSSVGDGSKNESVPEKRLAEDGEPYTREEFIDFLGAEEGKRSWDNAKPA